MSILDAIQKWWDEHPRIVGFIFALPIGMVVILATFFAEDTGEEPYAVNYLFQQLAIIISLLAFVGVASMPFISRKFAMVSMIVVYALIQFILIKFDITPSE
jgi:hypothetical protein